MEDFVSFGKIHIQENIKRNVYTLKEETFVKEEFKHEKINFGTKKEVMWDLKFRIITE